MTKKRENKKIEKKNNKNMVEKSENPILGLFKIVVIIIIAFSVFCVITYIVTQNNKNYTWENNETSSVIQYDEIMLGTLFNQPSSDYYVLVYNFSSDDKDIYDTYMSMYHNKENSLKVYTANLTSDFNKKYIGEKSNIKVNTIRDLKIKDVTLIRVKDSKVIEYNEGNEQVFNKFKDLVD